MRNHKRRSLRFAELVEALSHNAERINVKTRVRFVQDGECRFEHCHLEDFVALAFATRETLIDPTAHEVSIETHELALFAKHLEKIGGRERLLTEVFTLCVDGCAHEVGHRNTWNFDGSLERHEDTFVTTFLGFKIEKVFTIEDDFTFRYVKLRISHNHIRECGLTRAVRSHEHVHLTVIDGEVNAAKDFFTFYRSMKIAYFKHNFCKAV